MAPSRGWPSCSIWTARRIRFQLVVAAAATLTLAGLLLSNATTISWRKWHAATPQTLPSRQREIPSLRSPPAASEPPASASDTFINPHVQPLSVPLLTSASVSPELLAKPPEELTGQQRLMRPTAHGARGPSSWNASQTSAPPRTVPESSHHAMLHEMEAGMDARTSTGSPVVLGDEHLSGTAAVALHRSGKKWLDKCVNVSGAKLDAALPSSEYWRERRGYLFYKHLFCILHRFAPAARSVIDVGSALPPYVNALHWIKARCILGPRFAGNVAKNGGEIFNLTRIEARFNVSVIQSDFLKWRPRGWLSPSVPEGGPEALIAAAAGTTPSPLYDLVLCTEVVEHIAQPREFLRKLLAIGGLVVLSVPYRWESCENTDCHHKQNRITRDKIAAWAGRQPLAYDIVEEAGGEQRIICIYKQATKFT